jgi:hypothetical protein
MKTILIQNLLFALQALQVFILIFHDWIPFGRLNDAAAVRRVHGFKRVLIGTLINAVPFSFGLAASLYYAVRPLPHWLWLYLFIAYGILFAGEIESWWLTYFFGYKEATRASSYRTMFGNTHAFLPERHGIVPNTLHCALHAATLSTLILLLTL